MKFIKSDVPVKKFEPFSITIQFDTPEEARLMWHVMNRRNLDKVIFSENYNSNNAYNIFMAKHFSTDFSRIDAAEDIRIEITDHGVKI